MSLLSTPVEYEQGVVAIRCKGITLNLITRVCEFAGKQRELTAFEFKLMKFLLEHPATGATTEELNRVVGWITTSNGVAVYMNYLRGYFGKDFIKTMRGKGYRLGGAM